MEIQSVNNKPSLGNIAATAVLYGAIATGAERLALPATAKAALKNSRLTQDNFVMEAQKCAVEAMHNTGKKFDLEMIKENATKLYPEMKELGAKTKKSLGKTFVGVAAAIAGAKLLSTVILNKRAEKAQEQ